MFVQFFHILKTRYKKTLFETFPSHHWQSAVQLEMSLLLGQKPKWVSRAYYCTVSIRKVILDWLRDIRDARSTLGVLSFSESWTCRYKARVQPWESLLESKAWVLESRILGYIPTAVLCWEKTIWECQATGEGYNHPTNRWSLIHSLEGPSPRTMCCVWEAMSTPGTGQPAAQILKDNEQLAQHLEACH